MSILGFQSTLPRGERHCLCTLTYNKGKVSIHAPAGGATAIRHCKAYKAWVSIHAPAGGATAHGFCKWQAVQFQSTLPRGERPLALAYRHAVGFVSIHAPAGGATLFMRLWPMIPTCFNPRSRGGSDPVTIVNRGEDTVSIHAPAGGATVLLANGLCLFEFQSTLPRGERLKECWQAYVSVKFQSTLPRGERR